MAEPTTAEEHKLAFRLARFSAGAALVGALIGGLLSFGLASYTASLTADQARDEFLQTERRIAYGQYLADSYNLRNVLGGSTYSSPPSAADCGSLLREQQLIRAARPGYQAVFLVGDESVQAALKALQDVYETAEAEGATCEVDGAQVFVPVYFSDRTPEEIFELLGDFAEAARADLND